MSISLIGIIWVQIYWIHNGITVKEAQFDQLVNEALNHVVTDIEENESVDFVHNHLSNITSEFIIDNDSIPKRGKKIKQWVQKFTTHDSSDSDQESFNYEMTTDDNGDDVEMKISINGNTQIIDIKNKLQNLEYILGDDSLIMMGDDEVVLSDRFSHIMVKMAKEFKGIEKPIHHLLQSISIEPIIKSSLKDNGITTPFSYAIIHDENIIEQFSDDNYILSENNYNVSLFKHNLFDKTAVLSINFKGKRHYILKEMWLMVTCSILFTLIILLTFLSTIHYMIKQKKLSEMKNDFINNMTHEFKTPISTISLAVDSITHPKIIDDKTQINHFADIIRKENMRMNKQVESVLNTALGEKDELDFDKVEVNINELIQKIPSRMRLQLEAHKAVLSLNLAEGMLTILGDEMHLQNAICNLIDNAIKYNDNNPEITINTSLVNGYCELKISDNGIGMTSETQKKVFDKFYRVEKGNIHTIKGFGIGLSYVKAIVDAHKGLIAIKSKINQGTVITLNIPAS